jgi:hypothetical protein
MVSHRISPLSASCLCSVSDTLGSLPLNVNSTFLSGAYDAGQVPSQALGVFMGSVSMDAPEDGLIVVGGWDSGRVEGDMVDLDYDQGCTFCARVESMTFDTGNSSTELLEAPFRAIMHTSAVVTLPSAAFNRFQEASQVVPSELDPTFYRLGPDSTTGNVTVRLSNGYETTIPSYELFRRNRQVSDSGSLALMDEETYCYIANGTNTTPDDSLFGLPFLSQVYFKVDYDRQTASIGTARHLTLLDQLNGATGEQLETICPPEGAARPASQSSSSSGSGTNTGAIAGGVVGGIAGLALILFGIWFILRRRRRRNASHTTPTATEPKPTTHDNDAPPPSYAAHSADSSPTQIPSPTSATEIDTPGGALAGGELPTKGTPKAELASPEQLFGKQDFAGGVSRYDGVNGGRGLQELDDETGVANGQERVLNRPDEAVELPVPTPASEREKRVV